jgi:hypothetical protein
MPAERDDPELPDDFTVEDILRAPLESGRASAIDPAREARGALWELDFALQQLAWFQREGVQERPLLESIAQQLTYGTRSVERFPTGAPGLPAELAMELAERFARLTEALDALPPGWAGHEDLLLAHARLRTSLGQRGVDLD